MSVGWIVAYTKPAQERWAAENVARQGRPYYLPRLGELRLRKHHREETSRPLFPRYVFILVEHRWRFLLSTFGIVSVVMNGVEPGFLPDGTIERLRSREDEDGLVRLPSLLKAGDKVLVKQGPFAGQQGIYEGMAAHDRQRVLLDYLGRQTRVLIAEDLLQAA